MKNCVNKIGKSFKSFVFFLYLRGTFFLLSFYRYVWKKSISLIDWKCHCLDYIQQKTTSNKFFALMMMMLMMMMNCFCGMIDWSKVFSLISSWDHCQRSSPSRISDMPRAEFEPAQNLSSGLVEWSFTVVTTTTPWHHYTTALKY